MPRQQRPFQAKSIRIQKGAIPQPAHVWIVGGAKVEGQALGVGDRRHGAGVEPFVEFDMAIGESKSATTLVQASWATAGGAGQTCAALAVFDPEGDEVDAVGMFVDKSEKAGWPRDFGESLRAEFDRVGNESALAQTTDPSVEGNAADAREEFAFADFDHAFVARAFVDGWISRVRAEFCVLRVN